MNITLGTDTDRREAALRCLAENAGAIGRNGGPSLSELITRLADAAAVDPAGVAALVAAAIERRHTAPADRVTEVERAAITLLYNHGRLVGLWNPALSDWVESIGTNPDEARNLAQFEPGVVAREQMTQHGFTAAIDDDPRPYASLFTRRDMARAAHYDDRAAHRLASAVIRYRQAGRASELVATPLRRGGDDELGMSVVTSLAAAIGEYQYAMLQVDRPIDN